MISIKNVWFDRGFVFVELNNETVVGTPIKWYPLLSKGTHEQWLKYRIGHRGESLHWEELDEDLSLEHILRDVNTDPEK